MPSKGGNTMTPLRRRMIEDMTLAGLSEGTQRAYLSAIRRLAKHYGRSPEVLTETEVAEYLRHLIKSRVARGTFNTARFAIACLFENTLQRNWPLLKKSSARPGRSGSRRFWTTTASAA